MCQYDSFNQTTTGERENQQVKAVSQSVNLPSQTIQTVYGSGRPRFLSSPQSWSGRVGRVYAALVAVP